MQLEKFIQALSDECVLHECGLCASEVKTTEAKYFCKDCESDICDSCKGSHSRFKELRKHNIGAIDSNLDGAVGAKRSGFRVHEPRHDKTNKMSMHPAKAQISLGIRPVLSKSSLPARRNLGPLTTH